MYTAVREADATPDMPDALPPNVQDEFERLFADLTQPGGALDPSAGPAGAHAARPAAAEESARSWRRVLADDPGLLLTCGLMVGASLVVIVAWLHVLTRLDAVERRSVSAEERATAAVRAATASPEALRTATDVQRMMRVQSALDVAQLTARAGEGASAVQGHLWWSPTVGLALWARPVPIPGDTNLGYHAWLVTDAGTDYLGPVARDEAGTISASFDPPRHASSRVLSVLVVLQPSYRVDRPGDMVVLEAKF